MADSKNTTYGGIDISRKYSIIYPDFSTGIWGSCSYFDKWEEDKLYWLWLKLLDTNLINPCLALENFYEDQYKRDRLS